MIGNPLVNVLTPRIRGVLYAALFVAALVFSIYQASDGDWLVFIGSLITALLGLVAASNVSPTPVEPENSLDIEYRPVDTSALDEDVARDQAQPDSGYSSGTEPGFDPDERYRG